mmetsp:Transcript_30122/g.82763  ORF Transcript_30122/g.82763 Transcript_30122/m.82763 type:complete len:193 (-) Transcript_30122:156-734(-)
MLQATVFSQCSRLVAARSPSTATAVVAGAALQLPNNIDMTTRSFAKQKKKKKKEKVLREKKEFIYDPLAEANVSSGDKHLQLVLSALNAPYKKEGPISEEERARREQIVKTYTIQRFNQHNEWDHDMACKIKMKQHAIRMLPKNSKLKEEALFISENWWNDDPPYMRPPEIVIPGLDISKRETEVEDWEQMQ